MKRMFGFLLFCFGLGMMIKCFLPNSFCVFLVIGAFIILGSCMYQDKNHSSRKWDKFFCSMRKHR